MPAAKATLYGLNAGNCNRQEGNLWGKNQFNSTFPVSLCLFMRDSRIKPISVFLENRNIINSDDLYSMDTVIGAARNMPHYCFESGFAPFAGFLRNDAREHIDMVVQINGSDWQPLEIKLTVVPDSTTLNKSEDHWSPEIVLRPVSSAYAMMSVANSVMRSDAQLKRDVVLALKPAYNSVGVAGWENKTQILSMGSNLRDALEEATEIMESVQKPFLVQPIWKTMGQSFTLCENCFDVFVWSDASIVSLPAKLWSGKKHGAIRHLREIARHVRALYDILNNGDFDYSGTYTGMALGEQTDKAFSMSGNITMRFLSHHRLVKPSLSKNTLEKIVQGGGQYELRPERRFDAAVVAYLSGHNSEHFNRE